ncbi:MAG: hypothetical protein D6778_03735 [Nitrospirae bacterium]|nr:MAG: hypothetical protein D6778_03735 [Nitrospirota bacterium]
MTKRWRPKGRHLTKRRAKMKRIILLIGFCLVLTAGFVYAQDVPDLDIENSPSLGPSQAPVVIVEFLDYQ